MNTGLSSLRSLGVLVQQNVALSQWTTFRLGGPCPWFISCATPQQLTAAICCLAAEKTPFILIGGGSNLVVSDQGVSCAVIRYVSDKPIIDHSDDEIMAAGSTNLDSLALYAAEHGLEGLNYTSGIPGTVGGAVVGNAGAFGKQAGDVLIKAGLISRTGERRYASREELGFTYRNSRLKETGEIIATVTFSVSKGDREALLKERAEILEIRHEKHPDLNAYPCAGSFFRNIEPTSKAEKRQAAGWFLEQAGGKDLSVGGAKIFDKHANIIVKAQGCTAKNVYELAQKMAGLVKKAYGFDLVREVRFVGRLEGVKESEKELIW